MTGEVQEARPQPMRSAAPNPIRSLPAAQHHDLVLVEA